MLQAPVDLFPAFFPQEGIDTAEWPAAEESSARRQRAWMCADEHACPRARNPRSRSGVLSMAAPQEIGHRLRKCPGKPEGLRGKLLPAPAAMAARSPLIHGERRVEQQHTPIGPYRQISGSMRGRYPYILSQFLQDVL